MDIIERIERIDEFGAFNPKNKKPLGKGRIHGGGEDTMTPAQHIDKAIKLLNKAKKSKKPEELVRQAVMELAWTQN